MYITIELLQKHNACQGQLDLFAATFPAGVHVTEAVCLAVADKFNFDWAAACLLPVDKLEEYWAKDALICAEYEAKRALILAEYEAKRAPIWAEYEAKDALIWEEYNRQRAALFGRIAETVED